MVSISRARKPFLFFLNDEWGWEGGGIIKAVIRIPRSPDAQEGDRDKDVHRERDRHIDTEGRRDRKTDIYVNRPTHRLKNKQTDIYV